MVMKARSLEAQGLELKSIVKELLSYRNTILLRFYLSDIATIKRSKRISTFSPVGAPILNQKPVFKVDNGGVHYFTSKNTVFGCLREIVNAFDAPSVVVINYSSEQWAQELAEMVKKKLPEAEIILREITASLVINLGEDVICAVGG